MQVYCSIEEVNFETYKMLVSTTNKNGYINTFLPWCTDEGIMQRSISTYSLLDNRQVYTLEMSLDDIRSCSGNQGMTVDFFVGLKVSRITDNRHRTACNFKITEENVIRSASYNN